MKQGGGLKVVKSYLSYFGLFLFCFLTLFTFKAAGQDGSSDACDTPSDEAFQLVKDARNGKKFKDRKERYGFLKKAIEVDDQCASCYFELGRFNYKKARRHLRGYDASINYFLKMVEICPRFHSDAYYYLGTMYYAQRKYDKSLKYYKEFLEFKDGPKWKFAKDWADKVVGIEEMLPEIEFFANFYKDSFEFNPVSVPGISTAGDETFPCFSIDQTKVIFNRKYEHQARGDIIPSMTEKVFIADKTGDNWEFTNVAELPSPFNKEDQGMFAGASLSVNNLEMFVSFCEDYEGYNNCDIYRTEWSSIYDPELETYFNGWSEFEVLGSEINSPKTFEAQPCLSGDGKTLYFASFRPGGLGMDIYSSERDRHGTWSKAKKLNLNTDGNDNSPFIHPDGNTMYFSSNGMMGAGEYDFYYSKRKKNGEWGKPKNFGHPLNTDIDEVGIYVSTDGKKAFYSTSRNRIGKGGYDIYDFDLPDKAKPQRVVLVRGQVKNHRGEVLKSASMEMMYTQTKESHRVFMDTATGFFVTVMNLDRKEDAVMLVNSEGYVFSSQPVPAHEAKYDELYLDMDIKLEPIKVGKSYTISNIAFQENSKELTKESKLIIDQLVEFLLLNQEVKVSIHGHTDNKGDAGTNLKLSKERAKTVEDYITQSGIEEERLSSKGFGSTKPLGDNTTEDGRALNRRTEFYVVSN